MKIEEFKEHYLRLIAWGWSDTPDGAELTSKAEQPGVLRKIYDLTRLHALRYTISEGDDLVSLIRQGKITSL